MGKCIDAEKLVAEIERRMNILDTDSPFGIGGRVEWELVLDTITSLQQEQPDGLHFTPLNRLIKKIPSWNDTVNNYARKLRDCLIREGYRKDAEVLQCYISYMNGNDVPMVTIDEQEQPEVDLEKEMDKYYGMYRDKTGKTYDIENDEPCFDWEEDELSEHEMRLARHFYELGLKARKEDDSHEWKSKKRRTKLL